MDDKSSSSTPAAGRGGAGGKGRGKGDNPFGPYPRNEREDRYVFFFLLSRLSCCFSENVNKVKEGSGAIWDQANIW